ncbi:MAG: tetratricopeptide repeat protein, partial [Candidatus Rokuibacteriota bacterium]
RAAVPSAGREVKPVPKPGAPEKLATKAVTPEAAPRAVKPEPRAPAPESKPAVKPSAPAPAGPRPTLTSEQVKTIEDALALAQIFQDRGDNERALREYRRALGIDPTNTEAKQGLAAVEQALKAAR